MRRGPYIVERKITLRIPAENQEDAENYADDLLVKLLTEYDIPVALYREENRKEGT